jgi:hypothetical protein
VLEENVVIQIDAYNYIPFSGGPAIIFFGCSIWSFVKIKFCLSYYYYYCCFFPGMTSVLEKVRKRWIRLRGAIFPFSKGNDFFVLHDLKLEILFPGENRKGRKRKKKEKRLLYFI